MTNGQFMHFVGLYINPFLKSNQLTLGVIRRGIKIGKLREELVTEYLEIEKLGLENNKTEEEIKEEQTLFFNEELKKDFEPIDISKLEDLKREIVKIDESLDTKENLVDILDIVISFEQLGLIK